MGGHTKSAFAPRSRLATPVESRLATCLARLTPSPSGLAARQGGSHDFIIERPKAGLGIHEKHGSKPGDAFDPFIPRAASVFDEA